MVLKRKYLLSILLLGTFLLSACGTEKNEALQFPTGSDDVSPTVIATPYQEKVLSVCLGDEPTSLFLYGDLSKSAKIIRQAIYDGPIDHVDFQISSPLLSEIPSQENGLVIISQVEVFPGERIVDAHGNITLLTSGVEYRPSGCLYPECWLIYQGQNPAIMDQVEIVFNLEPGISWSDGSPLTALDSVFSYQVSQEIYGATGPRNLRFTAEYVQAEEQTIIWTGLPGYQGIYDYTEYFFSPLPEHSLGKLSVAQMLSTENITQQLLGWGPYLITEWVKGDHITLHNNENYHRASEGFPAYDALVFRFVTDGEEALAAYSSGECEIVLNEPDLFNYLPEIELLKEEGEINLTFYNASAWEQLSFGTNSLDNKRILLKDPNTRSAITQCINRQVIADSRVDAGPIVDSFFHPEDPRSNPQIPAISYQPQTAAEILENLGWIDHDQNPDTPRIASGVEGVADDTPFRLTLLVAGSEEEPLTAVLIKDQLSDCGIEVLIEPLPPVELLAPGPDGPVFGRRFDLALFAWSTGNYHLCKIFQTDEIPGIYPSYPKGWGGANAPGYSVYSFDGACDILTTSLPDSTESLDALAAVQTIFREDLPVLPLFFRQEMILSNSKFEGFQSGNYSPFWNIEEIR